MGNTPYYVLNSKWNSKYHLGAVALLLQHVVCHCIADWKLRHKSWSVNFTIWKDHFRIPHEYSYGIETQIIILHL